MLSRRLLPLVPFAALLLSAAAPPSEPLAIIYRDIGFRGPAVTLTGPRADLDLDWPILSIRVHRGVWELFTIRNYRGRCTEHEASERSIPSALEYVQSARPVTGPSAN